MRNRNSFRDQSSWVDSSRLASVFDNAFHTLADTGRLCSLDIVEFNPAVDVRNTTAALAANLVESLFGKSALIRKQQTTPTFPGGKSARQNP